jgi:hypothetical protein
MYANQLNPIIYSWLLENDVRYAYNIIYISCSETKLSYEIHAQHILHIVYIQWAINLTSSDISYEIIGIDFEGSKTFFLLRTLYLYEFQFFENHPFLRPLKMDKRIESYIVLRICTQSFRICSASADLEIFHHTRILGIPFFSLCTHFFATLLFLFSSFYLPLSFSLSCVFLK